MKKYVRCTIRRSNNEGEMYSNSRRPIGFGYQGKSFQLNEGEEVCIEKEAIYCFTDAVIEHEKVEKNLKTGQITRKTIRIPRFNIDYHGFYICGKECNGDYTKCTGREITRDEFFSDDPSVNERLVASEIFNDGIARKKVKKSEDEINDIEDILE